MSLQAGSDGDGGGGEAGGNGEAGGGNGGSGGDGGGGGGEGEGGGGEGLGGGGEGEGGGGEGLGGGGEGEGGGGEGKGRGETPCAAPRTMRKAVARSMLGWLNLLQRKGCVALGLRLASTQLRHSPRSCAGPGAGGVMLSLGICPVERCDVPPL